MTAAARQRTLEEKRAANREYQRRYRKRQHPLRREKIVPVAVCEELEAYLYAVQAVEKPSGNHRKHIGQGIERLLKVSMKNA